VKKKKMELSCIFNWTGYRAGVSGEFNSTFTEKDSILFYYLNIQAVSTIGNNISLYYTLSIQGYSSRLRRGFCFPLLLDLVPTHLPRLLVSSYLHLPGNTV